VPPTVETYETQFARPRQTRVDGRFVIVAIIFLVLILPVFPVDKVIYENGQTAITVVTQSTSYLTSTNTYATNSQLQIQVYKGNVVMLLNQSYYMYEPYYFSCHYDYYGYHCDYTPWPSYQNYTNSVLIAPSDQIVKMQITNETNGLINVTLTHYNGLQVTYRHVISENLAIGPATITEIVTTTTTNTDQVVNSIATTSTVPCHCIVRQLTERVSIIQLLLGLY
jgi:hypothetical protein